MNEMSVKIEEFIREKQVGKGIEFVCNLAGFRIKTCVANFRCNARPKIYT